VAGKAVLKELLEQEKRYLSYFFDRLDISIMEKIYQTLKSCQGLIILTGIGKSGLIAQKIAATMTSTSTRALYLSPVDALHGDIGIVSSQDVFILISKSGESEELMHLFPSLRNKGVKIICVVSREQSKLAKASDLTICLPLERELCPYNLAPTTSSVIQMIFGDIMAIALMKEKGFTLDEYALNHPAGQIGKRITLKVKDLMITGKQIPLCYPKDFVVNTLLELSDKHCGCVLIVDSESKLLGIFTDGDLRRTLQNKGADCLQEPIELHMTKNPRFTSPETFAAEALKLMEGVEKKEITVLPVLDTEKKVVGVIKLHDIIQTGI
jgi:arabinose-5-phosphate isomerase